MQEMLTNLSTYGYIVLFLYSLGGGFVALLAAGVLSFMGKMDLTLSISIAIIANILGDTLTFYLTRYHKKEMMGYLKKHRRKLAFSNKLFRKNGSWIIIVKKFIYGLKTLVPLAIGLSKYSFIKFSIYNTIGAVIWGVSIGGLSYIFANAIVNTYDVIATKPYIAPIVLLAVGGGAWLYLTIATKKHA